MNKKILKRLNKTDIKIYKRLKIIIKLLKNVQKKCLKKL